MQIQMICHSAQERFAFWWKLNRPHHGLHSASNATRRCLHNNFLIYQTQNDQFSSHKIRYLEAFNLGYIVPIRLLPDKCLSGQSLADVWDMNAVRVMKGPVHVALNWFRLVELHGS